MRGWHESQKTKATKLTKAVRPPIKYLPCHKTSTSSIKSISVSSSDEDTVFPLNIAFALEQNPNRFNEK